MARQHSTLLAAGLFAALTCALTYPLSLHPGTTVVADNPDNQLFIWTLAWNVHALTTSPLSIFDANIYQPQALTLAYSENLIGSTIVAAPALWLTGNPVFALNAVSLVSLWLCAVGGFLLARQLGLGVPAAIIAGLIFAFAPPRFFRTGQLHLGTVHWIPFALAFLHAYFEEGRPRDLRLAIGFVTLQVATTGHGGVFAIVACGVLAGWRIATGAPVDLQRRLRDTGITGAVLLLVNAALYVPYLIVQREMGLRRSLENWGATPESFLASPTALHAAVLEETGIAANQTATAYMFPGYLPLLLAVMALVLWRGAPRNAAGARDMPAFLALTVLAVLLAAGPPIGIWPLVYSWPGLNFIRVPSRFIILAMLGLAMLAAIGFEQLSARLTTQWRKGLAVSFCLALLVEFAAVPFPSAHYRVRIPAADRWLARQPTPFVVAEAPVFPSERYQTMYMLHSMAHWQKTVHGYSGLRPPLHDELYDNMRSFPDERSIAALRGLDVDYVVVHEDLYQAEQWESVEARLAAFSRELTPVYRAGAGRVYRLRR